MGLFDSSSNEAIVIGGTPILFPQNTLGQLTINNSGAQRFVNSLPSMADLVRMGKSYVVRATTGLNPLTALPTTVAGLTIYNGEAAGGPSYIIDSVFAIEGVLDATQQNQLAILGMVNKTPAAIPTDTLAAVIRNLSGKAGVYPGAAKVAAGATVVDEGWMPLGNSVPGAATVAGGLWRTTDIKLDGLYIVRPMSTFSLHATKVAATAAQVFLGIRFHEVQLDLG
jgi:hypothetical protein